MSNDDKTLSAKEAKEAKDTEASKLGATMTADERSPVERLDDVGVSNESFREAHRLASKAR